MNKHGSASNAELPLGFMSIYQVAGAGAVGALLVLNERARPLEFHCTAPVQPSRTQQILYGATLHPYLYGEEIAVALLRRARAPIALAITNERAMLAARHLWDRSICLLGGPATTDETDDVDRIPAADTRLASASEPLHPFHIGPFCCYCHQAHLEDAAMATSIWEQSTRFDLAEPFERLREAVEEAHRCQAA
jgi:hypothetical protein